MEKTDPSRVTLAVFVAVSSAAYLAASCVGEGTNRYAGLLERRLRAAARTVAELSHAKLVVFGHSHRAHVEWVEDTLVVNPGAVIESGNREQPSVARISIEKGKPKVEIIPLGR